MNAALTLIETDALAYLPTLPDASIDCVITDMPYPSLDKWRAIGTSEGETALDPFCGSGTLGVAAALTQRKAILIDTSKIALDTARARLAAMSGLWREPLSVRDHSDRQLRFENPGNPPLSG